MGSGHLEQRHGGRHEGVWGREVGAGQRGSRGGEHSEASPQRSVLAQACMQHMNRYLGLGGLGTLHIQSVMLLSMKSRTHLMHSVSLSMATNHNHLTAWSSERWVPVCLRGERAQGLILGIKRAS